MKRIDIIVIFFFIVSLFPFVTKIVSKESSKELLKGVMSPDNLTLIEDKGADEPAIILNEWMNTVKIARNGVIVKKMQEEYRGVYASRDIEEGEEIMVAPLNAMIYEEFPTEDPVVRKAKRVLNGNYLVAIILYQEMKNANSRFTDYFEIFPKNLLTFPLFYSAESLKFIKGTSQYTIVQDFTNGIMKRYNIVKREIPELRNMTKEEFFKVYAYVASRTTILPINGNRQYALVPMLDMFNAYPPNKEDMNSIRLDYKPRGKQYLTITTKKKINANEELYHSYKLDYSNTDYLLYYGFVFEDIHEVSLKIRLFGNFTNNTKAGEKKNELLKTLGYLERSYVDITISNSTNEQSFWPLYSAVRIIMLETNTTASALMLDSLVNDFKDKKRKNVGRLSNSNEKLAMDYLVKTIDKILKRHPSSLQEDEQLLKSLPMHSTARDLIHLRHDEKMALLRIKAYCQNSLAEIVNKTKNIHK